MSVIIAKADGTGEVFKREKLLFSLRRSGADSDIAEHITKAIERELHEGMTTGEIYAKAFAHLRRHPRGLAARYSLKRAILDFGPSGFPFESYIAELLRAEGYTTSVDVLVPGRCVEHEVDVVAKKNGTATYVEAKFHNSAGFKTDVKTVLYVKARMDDIKDFVSSAGLTKSRIHGMIVTNTKFTSQAVQFASCASLQLLGWEYPEGKTLHDRIHEAELYPITALTTLKSREKMELLRERIVLCKDLSHRTEELARVGVTSRRAEQVFHEIGALCVPGKGI